MTYTTEGSVPPLITSESDDPRVVAAAATEDYALHATPLSWRMRKLSLMSSWWALCGSLFWLIFGALIALTVGTVDAVIGMLLAVVAYSSIGAVFTRSAARHGLTSNLFSRAVFGASGSVIAPLLIGVMSVYFTSFEGSVIAIALQKYFGGPIQMWYAIVVIYSVPLVFGALGKFLDKFNGVLFPVYMVGLIAVVVWTGCVYGFDGDWASQRPATLMISGPGWLWAFTAYIAILSLTMNTWDFARLAKHQDRRFHSVVTFGPVFYFVTFVVNGVAGIFIALTIPTEGPLTEISGVLGIVAMMGFLGVFFVWASQTRINTANLYLAITNLEGFFARLTTIRLNRIAWAVIVGVVAYLIMLCNVFEFMLPAVRYQAVVAVTWVACALTFLTIRKLLGEDPANLEWRPGRVPRFDRVGTTSWALGTLTGFGLLTFGDPASWTATWALALAFAVSAVSEACGLFARGRSQTVLERTHDPRDEVSDPWSVHVQCHVCARSYIAVEMDRDPSSGYEAICAEHAQSSPVFLHAARREATAERGAASTL
ncbi:thiamine permease [Mycolicibacterium farcinogenes]|nr:thiamine permease [Mycolicibacterium farcinogenes]